MDPYYLTHKADMLGYHPQVILAGRRINDGMAAFVAQKLVKLLIGRESAVRRARVGVLGLTFKENVPDLRNSRVPDIVRELASFGIAARVHDPLADVRAATEQYGIELCPLEQMRELDALVLAVPHRYYLELGAPGLAALLDPGGILIDVRSVIDPASLPDTIAYWSL